MSLGLRRVGPAALIAAALMAAPDRALAVDPFEIQVYDGSANPAGVPGLELHVNHVVGGVPAVPSAAPADGTTHLTLEPSLGVTTWWELGAYVQTAVRADGQFDYAGVKLRSKFVARGRLDPRLRVGVNLELSRLPPAYDRDRWGGEIRPIVAWEDRRWLVAVNPIVGTPLAGAGWRQGPTFEPAAQALWKVRASFAAGLEYYAGLGSMRGFSALRDQEHYLYEVVSLLAVQRLELNVGVGEGLTAASNGLVVKMILGWSLEPANR